MPCPTSASANSSQSTRLVPWRGPLHFLLLGSTTALLLMLLLSYLLLVAGILAGICLHFYEATGHMAAEGLLQWGSLPSLLKFAFLAVTWLLMLRPLRPPSKRSRAVVQATAATQPQLFALIHSLCLPLRAQPPTQVWLDTTATARSSMHRGLMGIFTGNSQLHLGMPVVSVITARELGGLLAAELSHHAGGASTVFVHAVREMNAWFYRAVMERDEWEVRMQEPVRRESSWSRLRRQIIHGWSWAAKIPFLLLALTSRLLSQPALRLCQRIAERTGENVIGVQAQQRMRRKLALLVAAQEAAEQELRRGMAQGRLPENLSLLMARHVAAAAVENAARRTGEEGDSEAPQDKDAPAAHLVSSLSPAQPAAAMLKQFVDLSRQVTYFYYQHELGLNLHEHRMVADEEVIHQNRREEQALLVIRRYFGGLAHPERAMCGLDGAPTKTAARTELQRVIREARSGLIVWGPQHKAALNEWNQAWQRRRDLEAAATLSAAGFSVSRMQFGTEDTTPNALRSEAARQRLVMEHMEGPLQERERILEGCFSAALGLLWWSQPEELSDWLCKRRRDLAPWVTVYEALCSALPSFRELLTHFFAFQTLGAKFANLDDPSAFLTSLQSVVPKMLNLVRQIVSTMDGAPYPFAEGSARVSLNEHLLPSALPQTTDTSLMGRDLSDMRATALKMASQASECVAPFVDSFLALYHRSFAWLAETAERTETHFMGALDLGAATEILLPEEFATQRLGIRPQTPDSIVAWKSHR